ncbi:MAG: site-specific DNA-methyltransferase [bacterium]|nr:site-specific DNA-methyltransferase [bacterium]
MKNLQIQSTAITSLAPYSRNARIHSAKQIRQIASSIQEFGFLVPVLIDGVGSIIAGHGRVLAAQHLGIKEIPCISADHLTEPQKRAYILADNKLTENAGWDEQMLSLELKELSALDLGFSLEITGFHSSEIDTLIESHFEVLPEEAEEDSTPRDILGGGSIITRPGDIWVLGDHRIICGNSLDSGTYESLLEGHKAQMVITDPPYNVRVDGHVCGLGKIRHKEFSMASGEMTADQFTAFLSTAFGHMAHYSEDGSIHFIFMDWRHLTELLAAGHSAYAELKNLCVWVKDNGGMGTFYRSRHELVFAFKSGSATHINNFELGQHGRHRTNVWRYPGVNSFAGRSGQEGNLLKLHPTVKPVRLVEDAIRDCSHRGGIILDPFLGSGTAVIAAEKIGRRCYGIELEPAYVDTAIRRWQKLTGKEAVRASCGTSFNVLPVQVVGETAHVE